MPALLRLAPLALLIAFGVGCGLLEPPLAGSGTPSTEDRAVSPYHRVKLVGGGTITLVPGTESSVRVTCDDNLLPHLTTEVEGDELVISYDRAVSTSVPLEVRLTTDRLDALELIGGSSATLGRIEQPSLVVKIVGGGEVSASGKVDRTKVEVVGSGKVELSGIDSREAEFSITGSGEISAHVTEKAEVKIVGSGDIDLTGPATVEKQVVGSGNVRHDPTGQVRAETPAPETPSPAAPADAPISGETSEAGEAEGTTESDGETESTPASGSTEPATSAPDGGNG